MSEEKDENTTDNTEETSYEDTNFVWRVIVIFLMVQGIAPTLEGISALYVLILNMFK